MTHVTPHLCEWLAAQHAATDCQYVHTVLFQQLNATVPLSSAAAQQHDRRHIRLGEGAAAQARVQPSLLLHQGTGKGKGKGKAKAKGKSIWWHEKAAKGKQTGHAVLSRSMLGPES